MMFIVVYCLVYCGFRKSHGTQQSYYSPRKMEK